MSNNKRNELQRKDSQLRRLLREKSFRNPEVRHPFQNHLKLSCCDKFKVAFCAVFFFPFRLIIIISLLIIAIIFAAIAIAGIPEEVLYKQPLKGWRKRLRNCIPYIGRLILFTAGFYYIKINGKRATRRDAPIIVAAPHSGYMDLVIAYSLDIPCCVSKIENSRLTIFGVLIRAMQPIFVMREDSQKKSEVINEIKARSTSDSEWPQLFIFPEGTCTNRSCLIKFKQGAFIPGVPIQPLILQYKNKHSYTCWTWDGLSPLGCAFYTLCQFYNNVEITYLPVYAPSEQEKNDHKVYANNVRQIMAEFLNLPVTDHTFEDVRLLLQAKRHRVPVETGLVEFSKLNEKLGLKYENCKEMLEKFIQISRKSTGRIDLNDFCNYLELSECEPVIKVFKLYDRDCDGTIDFREFLIGLNLLTKMATSEDMLQTAFKLFDSEGKGHITQEEMLECLCTHFDMSPENAKILFSKLDMDADNRISYDEFKKFALNKPEFATVFLTISGVPVESILRDHSIDSVTASIRNSMVSDVYEASPKKDEHVSLLLGNEMDQCHTNVTKPFNLSLQCNNMSLNVC